MRVDNLYKAIASQDLFKHSLVVIRDGRCFPVSESDYENNSAIYSLIWNVDEGEVAGLSGCDTVFHIQED